MHHLKSDEVCCGSLYVLGAGAYHKSKYECVEGLRQHGARADVTSTGSRGSRRRSAEMTGHDANRCNDQRVNHSVINL